MKLTVKDWFQEKIAREMNTKVFSFEIVAVSKQSEKAFYATMIYRTQGNGSMHMKTMWIPKSCCEGTETAFVDTYEEAAEIARHEIAMVA